MDNIVVTLQFFASLREELGINKIQVSLPRKMAIKELLEYVSKTIVELHGLYSKVSNNASIKYIFLLDGNTINFFDAQIINSGSELSILPPIGGG